MRHGEANGVDANEDGLWSIAPYEALVFMEHGGEVVPARLDVQDSIAHDVHYITAFVKGLIQTKRPLLTLHHADVAPKGRSHSLSIKATKGGECFLKGLAIDLDRILDHYPDIGKFNRYFGIYHDAVTREVKFSRGLLPFASVIRLEWLPWRDRVDFPADTLTTIVRHANEAVEQIRQQGRSDEFRLWLTAIERQPAENEAGLLALINASLAVNHHILVLRFDLGYAQLYCDPDRSGAMAVSYDEMRRHRIAFRRYLKRDLRRQLPAGACRGMVFALKLEYGLDKGYHFHAIVVLNADVVCNDAVITGMICAHWKGAITHGRGGACNCNVRRYRRRGIGAIRYTDADKLEILRTEVVPYITKPDFYGRMVKPDGHRTFWTSHPPKAPASPKGRKRAGSSGEETP